VTWLPSMPTATEAMTTISAPIRAYSTVDYARAARASHPYRRLWAAASIHPTRTAISNVCISSSLIPRTALSAQPG
jgi:hypothetical protein